MLFILISPNNNLSVSALRNSNKSGALYPTRVSPAARIFFVGKIIHGVGIVWDTRGPGGPAALRPLTAVNASKTQVMWLGSSQQLQRLNIPHVDILSTRVDIVDTDEPMTWE